MYRYGLFIIRNAISTTSRHNSDNSLKSVIVSDTGIYTCLCSIYHSQYEIRVMIHHHHWL